MAWWNGENPQIENSLQFRCGYMASKQIKPIFQDAIIKLPMSLSLQLGTYKALFTHGTMDNINELVYPDNIQTMENILEHTTEDIFANGHTHMSWKHYKNLKLGFNPGSVGLQHDGIPGHAVYALLDVYDNGYDVKMMKILINMMRLENNMIKSGWMEEAGILARLALDEVKTGRKHILPFVRYAYDYYKKEGVIPNEVWESATTSWLGLWGNNL
jgi:predicted phosphodiesterase